MKRIVCLWVLSVVLAVWAGAGAGEGLLGLPKVPVPRENPQTPEKIRLGEKLFHDERFSSTGKVSCATCHAKEKAFTDHLPVSEGIDQLKGTRNAPTVLNAAYFETQFWDGRELSLEDQAAQPFTNPVEMGLKDHEPILKIVRTDPEYGKMFAKAFGAPPAKITMKEVTKAIASFERTLVAGDSPFDRYFFGGDKKAMTPAAVRGLEVFLGKGRCVSCHTIEPDHALFTNNQFHNIGVAALRMPKDLDELRAAVDEVKKKGVDAAVLTNPATESLGRFAVTGELSDLGAFKTSTLRNIELTAPYMHDGSLKTLEEVVEFYDNGGRAKEADPVPELLDGGIRPLGLTPDEETDLVEFMKALTSYSLIKK